MTTFHGGQILGDQILKSGSAVFSATNPATGERLPGDFHEATTAEIERALRLAVSAQLSLKRIAPARRADLLDAVADGIDSLGDTLLDRAQAETGLPLPRLTAERGRTTGQLRGFAHQVREGLGVATTDPGDPSRTPLAKPNLTRVLRGIGPVAVFGASNFPLAFSVAGGDAASALAAGCTVIVKAHPAHPGTSELVGSVFAQAIETLGLHEGIFGMIQGQSHETGVCLVQQEPLRAVAFTGSFAGGAALFRLAAQRKTPIPVFAEMGSTNPVFLLPGALQARAESLAAGLAGSVCQGAGQFCTNPGLLVALTGPATDRLAAALAKGLSGQALHPMLHAGLRDAYVRGLEAAAQITGVERRVSGGAGAGHADARPALLVTTAERWMSESLLQEEIFGPATLLVICTDPEQMRSVAARLPGQLTATLHAEPADFDTVRDLLPILEEKAGRLLFGGVPTGVEVSPAMHHGGPWPATTDARFTSVGAAAVERFLRPVCYQDFPAEFEIGNSD
ncbi:MAG: aldehyde dehydrogenase (NADP(+)) [Planctomycetes bacterium]|nr:aldehyde dehydrogenase (NADP(+)) [Planctomycetota bacterium]